MALSIYPTQLPTRGWSLHALNPRRFRQLGGGGWARLTTSMSSKALLMNSPQPQTKTRSNIVARFCKIIRELCTCLTEQLSCQGGENLSVKDAGAASHFSKLSARSCRRWRK